MIITENITINNIPFIKTYSNLGYAIERDGVQYSEAIDPAEFNRVYIETDVFIEGEEQITDEELISMLEEVL
jgi:hypothetical protein